MFSESLSGTGDLHSNDVIYRTSYRMRKFQTVGSDCSFACHVSDVHGVWLSIRMTGFPLLRF